MYSYVDRSLGPAGGGHDLLVLRGKLPTTPRTSRGAATMQANTQMRYWSLCQNDSLPRGRVGDCLHDEEIPTDADRFYTIVISRPVDDPRTPLAPVASPGLTGVRWGRGSCVPPPGCC